MNAKKVKTAIVSSLIIAVVGILVWQKSRIRVLTAENEQLRQPSAVVAKLPEEVNRPGSSEADRAELARLRPSQAEKLTELHTPRVPVTKAWGPDADAGQLRAELERQKNNGSQTNQSGAAMQGMVEQMTVGKLARMKEKLNLAPEQEQAIGDILRKQAEPISRLLQKRVSGQPIKDEVAELQSPAGNPEEQIKALLSPEQMTAYQDYKRDEAAGAARLSANGEMLQMQVALGLTQQQQDQVFPVLYGQALGQMSGEPADAPPADGSMEAWFNQQNARKNKALEGILTPAQLESYRQMQQSHLKMMKAIESGEDGGETKDLLREIGRKPGQ